MVAGESRAAYRGPAGNDHRELLGSIAGPHRSAVQGVQLGVGSDMAPTEAPAHWQRIVERRQDFDGQGSLGVRTAAGLATCRNSKG